MKPESKQTNFPFVMLYAIALALAIVGRIGIAVLDGMDGVVYDYISVSSGSLFVQLLSIFTGAQLYVFMCAMALLCCVLLASAIMHGIAYAEDPSRMTTGRVVLASIVTALVAFLCLIIPISGVFSGVQVWGLKIQAPITGAVIGMGLIAFLAMAALVFASIQVVDACIATASGERSLWIRLLISSVVCGLVVVVLSAFTFHTMDTFPLNATGGMLWFGIALVVNLAIGFGALAVSRRQAAA